MVSNRGPQLSSALWTEVCKFFGATSSLSSGFYPQSNGQTERNNQDMQVALRCMVSRETAPLSSLLVWVEYTHKFLISLATGFSLFHCVYGYQPPFPALSLSCPSALAYIRWCTRTSWTLAGATLLRSIGHDRGFGFPPRTYLFGWSLGSFCQGLWVLFPSRAVLSGARPCCRGVVGAAVVFSTVVLMPVDCSCSHLLPVGWCGCHNASGSPYGHCQ